MMKKTFFIFSMLILTAMASCAPNPNLFSEIIGMKPEETVAVQPDRKAEADKDSADKADKPDVPQAAESAGKSDAGGSDKDSADKTDKPDKADAPQAAAAEHPVADAPGSAPQASEGESPKVGETDYKIGSGDVLEIITWKEPDFSKELLVRIDGSITFPLIDDIHVGGLTPLQVKQIIEDKLKEYIENPIVNVTVKTPESQKFYILGEVSKTGEYPLIKNLTVLQAFALAGGFTEWASKKEIILIRHEDGKEQIIRINYKNIAKGKDFSQNIFIKANDTIIVP
jgi:polysaccharide export outer membrane protein